MNSFLKAASVFLFLLTGAVSHAETYIVKKGDTIANIARKQYGEPVFGPKGSIKKIYKLNPTLKANATLEKGQKIELEGKSASEEGESTAAVATVLPAKAPPVKEAIVPETPPMDMTPYLTAASKAAHEKDIKKEVKEQEPAAVIHEPPPVAPALVPLQESVRESVHESAEKMEPKRGNFSFIASYSMITQAAKETATGESFTMHSNPSWSAELGWDHYWNDSFSTVLTYSATQFTSKESSEATGEKILKNAFLNRTELALLNSLVHWMRFGAGAAYGDHIFLESFSSAVRNPQVYKWSYLNPFLMAEITPYENSRYELLVNLKISQLPAQTGLGHDIASGTEYFGQIACTQKFEKFSMIYGLSYSTEDQTRTDAKETRTETALRVGALF